MTTATIAITTAPDEPIAKAIAKGLLESRLAACVTIIDSVQSFYWWQGKIDTSMERLLLIKTQAAQAQAIKQFILDNHPYDLPELVFVPITDGLAGYLQWIKQETRP